MSHFVRHDDKWRRQTDPPPTPPEDEFMPLGKARRGSFNPFDLKEEIPHFVRNDGVDDFLSFGEKLGEFSTSFQITV